MEQKNSPDPIAVIFISIALAIASFGIFIVLFLPESYIPWNPTIDTVLPAEFTDGKFKLLEMGTTKEEVLEILGEPNTVSWEKVGTQEWSFDDDEWVYGYDGACSWCDYAWLEYYIKFDARGRAIEKNREIHYD